MARFLVTTILLLLVVGAFWLFEGDLPAETVDARYASASSRFLEVDGGARLHYRDEGRRAGLPVVLVHGANASLHAWEPWVGELGDTYRVVTLDLPGHGLTGAVPDADYSRGAQLRAVSALADHLGLERFVLGGNSMGGGVAWRFALDHPGRVLALVLVDPVPPAAWRAAVAGEPRGPAPVAFTLLGQPWFRAVARFLDPYPLLVQGLPAAYNDAPVVDDALIARYRDLTLREGTRAAILERFARRAPEDDGDPALITHPTLVLWGEQDTLIDVAYGARFRDALTNAELIVYPDLGHVPMEEAPARSAADVRRFLDSLAP